MSYQVQCNVCEDNQCTVFGRDKLVPDGWVNVFVTCGVGKQAVTAQIHVCPTCSKLMPGEEARLEELLSRVFKDAIKVPKKPLDYAEVLEQGSGAMVIRE